MSNINNLKNKQSGFTIIEVVLVLAIAGLIFLIVFLALPQLQTSRRDTQRRGDGGKVVSALESYAGNNNGTYPTTAANQSAFETQYTTGQIQDPDGNDYTIDWTGSTTPAQDNMSIGVGSGNGCDGAALGAREVVVRVGLEQGVYCQDNK